MFTTAQRLALAVQHHQAGRLEDAERLYRSILHEEPHHPHALHLLEVRLHQAGRHGEAIELIRKALEVHGPSPVFHCNLAVAYHSAGLLTEAETHCQAALRLQPNYPDVLSNLGLVLRQQGRLAAALSVLQQALHLEPNFPDALSNLGLVLQDLGRLTEAAQAFRAALRLDPYHAEAQDNLKQLPQSTEELLARLSEKIRLDPGNAQAQSDYGYRLLALGEPEQALPHLQESLRLRPDDAETLRCLGLARQNLNQADAALQCFREAIRLQPTAPKARNNLGIVLAAQGRIAEARTLFLETLQFAPNDSQALFSLSEMTTTGHHQFHAEDIQHLRQLTTRQELPIDDRCRMHFALALVLDRAGLSDEAFANCRQANALRQEIDRRCGVRYDPQTHTEFVDRLIDTFSPSYFERVRAFGLDSELPLFIVGMPRSGTTLVEQILASHPQVFGAGELRDLGKISNSVLPQRLGAAEGYPVCLSRLDAATAQDLAEQYRRRLQCLGGSAARVVDKLPTNFVHLGLAATLFPKARIIHCRRHPLDTCLSCFFQNFAGFFPFKLELRHLAHYFREYERLMAHWQRVLPVPIFEVCYEELTNAPETVSRQLIDFCGLAWEDHCLRFHETRRDVWTASKLQVREPMYRRSVGRWHRYQAHLRDLIEELQRVAPQDQLRESVFQGSVGGWGLGGRTDPLAADLVWE